MPLACLARTQRIGAHAEGDDDVAILLRDPRLGKGSATHPLAVAGRLARIVLQFQPACCSTLTCPKNVSVRWSPPSKPAVARSSGAVKTAHAAGLHVKAAKCSVPPAAPRFVRPTCYPHASTSRSPGMYAEASLSTNGLVRASPSDVRVPRPSTATAKAPKSGSRPPPAAAAENAALKKPVLSTRATPAAAAQLQRGAATAPRPASARTPAPRNNSAVSAAAAATATRGPGTSGGQARTAAAAGGAGGPARGGLAAAGFRAKGPLRRV